MSRLFDKSGTTHRFLGIPFHFSFHKNILLFGIINLKSIVILWNKKIENAEKGHSHVKCIHYGCCQM